MPIGRWRPRPSRHSTTCESPPSACVAGSSSPAPAFGEEARTAGNAAKQPQSVLGDLHDCDLMLAKVEGVGSLTPLLRSRRQGHFHRFSWGARQAAAGQGVWADLERTTLISR